MIHPKYHFGVHISVMTIYLLHPVRDAKLCSKTNHTKYLSHLGEMRPMHKRSHLFEMRIQCLKIYIAIELCISPRCNRLQLITDWYIFEIISRGLAINNVAIPLLLMDLL